MPEINITRLVTDTETWDLTGSVATHGPNVARNTWENALQTAQDSPLLTTEEELQAMRDWAYSSGGWDENEIDSWSDQELNALFLQLVAGDMREIGLEDSDLESFDWAECEQRQSAGEIPCNIYLGSDGEVYFSLDS